MPTLGDVFRAYIKPSLDGEIIIRKKNTVQTSARVEAVKSKLRETKNTDRAPAKVAHEACVKAGRAVEKRVYVPGKGYETRMVCPISEMRSFLREAMKGVVS